ncbi:DNA polymerase III [Planctomycetales bacterium]|nr:DNA polymerase III [Planctomycetales bacterium]
MPISDKLLDDILLSMVEGIGSRTAQQLLERFGSSTAILNASRNELNNFAFLKPDTISQLVSARKNLNPLLAADLCERQGIDILSIRDKNYPEPLRTIADPPQILYVRGQLLPQDAFSIAVIGTRRCTSYGTRLTEKLTTALVHHGLTIISGLALGIDGIAHRTALKHGGRTIAVLGSGFNKVYPPEHTDLAEEIVAQGGALLSEYPPLHSWAKWTFPQRNRIVSGLSLGVLVIEAPLRSGAMISARLAGEQGRDIFAVPGRIDATASQGCHQLIKNGAYLTESADDILNVLGPLRQPVLLFDKNKILRHPNEVSINDIEERVLQCVATNTTELETIVSQSGLELHQVIAALDVLECKRIIRQLSPSTFVRI